MSKQQPESAPNGITASQTAHLLSVARSPARRRVDQLLEYMTTPAAVSSVIRAIEQCCADATSPTGSVLSASATLDEIEELKNRAKALFAKSRSGDERRAGIAAYFLSIAAALCRHGVLITDRPRDQVADDLLDLATVMPDPFQQVLAEGSLKCGDIE